jgi:hypothetical protein
VPPQSVDPETLDHLKREATTRAEALGHRLEAFRTAKHDPLCHVSFCADCRQMVIVSLEHVDNPRDRALFGYALEAQCLGRTAAPPIMAAAENR